MNTQAFTEAVMAVGDTVRKHTTIAPEGVAIMAAAMAFDACNSKAEDCTWEELEQHTLALVMESLRVSRQTLTKHAPHG